MPCAAGNDAEWLVETVTSAVKAGRGDELADIYDASALKAKNDGVLASYMGEQPEDLPASVSPGGRAMPPNPASGVRRAGPQCTPRHGPASLLMPSPSLGPTDALSLPGPWRSQVKRDLAVKRATVTSWWHGLLMLLKYRATKNVRDGNYLGPRCEGCARRSCLLRRLDCWMHCWLPPCVAA
jgi:hypothetical protein